MEREVESDDESGYEDAGEEEAQEGEAQAAKVSAPQKRRRRDYAKCYRELAEGTGITDTAGLPPRQYAGDSTSATGRYNWRKRSVRHLTACIAGRGDGADIQMIFDALKRAGYDEAFMALPDVRRYVAKEVINAQQSHWSARLAVHLWDRLELSRSQCETLRHLLSFVYDPDSDSYVPIK
eukprot:3361978-Pleurochrysis_carterae.AAC.1